MVTNQSAQRVNVKNACLANGGSVVIDDVRFTLNYGVDSDCIIVGNVDGGYLGTMIAHPGWAWWPVRNRKELTIGYVRKDGLYGARMLRSADETSGQELT